MFQAGVLWMSVESSIAAREDEILDRHVKSRELDDRVGSAGGIGQLLSLAQ